MYRGNAGEGTPPVKSRLTTRVERLEQITPKRPIRGIFDDHREPRAELERRIAEAEAEGFDVIVMRWTKPETVSSDPASV